MRMPKHLFFMIRNNSAHDFLHGKGNVDGIRFVIAGNVGC